MRKLAMMVLMAVGCAGQGEEVSNPMPGTLAQLTGPDQDGVSKLMIRLDHARPTAVDARILLEGVVLGHIHFAPGESEHELPIAIEGGAKLTVSWDPDGGSLGSHPHPLPDPHGPAT